MTREPTIIELEIPAGFSGELVLRLSAEDFAPREDAPEGGAELESEASSAPTEPASAQAAE